MKIASNLSQQKSTKKTPVILLFFNLYIYKIKEVKSYMYVTCTFIILKGNISNSEKKIGCKRYIFI